MNRVVSSEKLFLSLLLSMLIIGGGARSVLAQESSSVLYIPLIGITSVPDPLALPNGEGTVTYNYAVKNFLSETALTEIAVVDDHCAPVKYKEGDDNSNKELDYSETWRYTCTAKLYETTQSVATATGHANNITAKHKAYSTVVVGREDPAPIVSIINVTKIASPLSLPEGGGDITFTYRVNNPGIVPLTDVSVTDDKCKGMSGRVGDTNANNLLDIQEVWIYRCTTRLTQTTTNTVTVRAYGNGFMALADATTTVDVDTPERADMGVSGFPNQTSPNFPDTGGSINIKVMTWGVLSTILAVLLISSILIQKRTLRKKRTKFRSLRKNG